MERRTFVQGVLATAALWQLSPAQASQDTTIKTVDVKTRTGVLRGRVKDSVRSFKGIPFARPPIGPRRFQAPQSPLPWHDVREAFEFGPAPIQQGRDASTSSEDCLYLNVWAPDGPGPYPVFVWIHGGGNTGGWTNDSLANGTVFARSGVVCVTLGYRLGALGFMEMSDLLGPEYLGSANNGIKDLAMGVRWVKENIAAFGGDPSRITLAGESAGAKDVAAVIAVPDANKPIRRAIMESGSGQTVHTLESARDVAQSFLSAMGITKADAHRLMDVTPAELMEAQHKLNDTYPEAFPFRPVVDGHFFTKRPVDMIAEGSAKHISLIVGTNRDESLLFFPRSAASHPIAAREVANVPLATMEKAEALYHQHFPDLSDLDRRIHLLTSEEYWIPSVRVAESHAVAGGETRVYRFEHTPLTGDHAGYATHGAELQYVWDTVPSSHTEGYALARKMHDSWCAFVASGIPHTDGLPDWPLYDPKTRRTLIFGQTDVTVAEDPSGMERALWDGLV